MASAHVDVGREATQAGFASRRALLIRTFTRISALVIAAACAAVAPPARPVTPEPPPRTVALVDDDAFDSTLTVSGPLRWAVIALPSDSRAATLGLREPGYFLQSRINKHSASTSHILVVSHTYTGDWIFWDRANLDDQQSLEFVPSEQKVLSCSRYGRSCSHREVFGATLADSLLVARPGGLRVKFYSSTGRTGIFAVDSGMVREQLRVVDSVRTAISRPPQR